MNNMQYDQTCMLTNTRTEVEMEAEVMNFRPEDGLTVVIASNKIVLKYVKRHGIYVGNLSGMEFTSKGPKYYETKVGRR